VRYYLLFVFLFSILFSIEKIRPDSIYTDPKTAWKLGMIPGAGQLYNKKYIKSLAFLTGECLAVAQFYKYKQKGNIRLRNTYAWWVFILYVWGMLDSYVDAHLSTFPENKLESTHPVDSLKVNK
tara:strand:- start:919 stop:1290 length:372 start_codon:yes stop_codon:yes gene_type:complete